VPDGVPAPSGHGDTFNFHLFTIISLYNNIASKWSEKFIFSLIIIFFAKTIETLEGVQWFSSMLSYT
jgi:hypothetical protein